MINTRASTTTEKWKSVILFIAVASLFIAGFVIPRIPQNESYHQFADTRALGSIPNALNVLSNALFLVVGVLGMRLILRNREPSHGPLFIDSAERWPYFIFFLGVALTTFGSGYYHTQPGDARLTWDRLPMTIGFMSLLAATIDERISVKSGLRLLAPLLIFGAISVLYWNFTELSHRGDLRPYALVQFGSLVILLLLVALFRPRYSRACDLIVALGIYAVSKVLEGADRVIFSFGGIVSGHTLKHVTAGISAYWIYRMLKLRSPITAIQ